MKQITGSEAAKFAIEISTVLLLLGTAIFTGLSWRVFERQLSEMERVYGPIQEQAAAAQLSAIAANTAAQAAHEALQLTSDTAEKQLRSYLLVDTDGFEFKGSDIKFKVRNFGQTPAKNVSVHTNLEFRPKGEGLPSDFKFPDRPVCGNLSPTGPNLGSIAPGASTLTARVLCGDEIKSVRQTENGGISGFLYGRINYMDIFNKSRSTTFCIRIFPVYSELCEKHNETDPKE